VAAARPARGPRRNDRGSRASAASASLRIQGLLAAGIVVLIFPEGTSSDGSTVLRFYPSLFEPAVRTEMPATAAAIRYSAEPFAIEKELCYYGDIRFGPHLLQTLQLPSILASIRFASPGTYYQDRKQAAAATRAEVLALRDARSGPAA
jgi:1-acyl-sn-glycerol-3-phosphate acyltransferase